MRRKLVLGCSLAGMFGGSAAVAQFAADRVPGGAAQPRAAQPFGGAQQPNPAPFGGGQPVGAPSAPVAGASPGGSVTPPPVGGFQPATTAPAATPGGVPATTEEQDAATAATAVRASPLEIPSALGPNHPLAVRPEHGGYFICVKSYSRPARPDARDPGLTARELAEGLAAEIQRMPQAKGYNVFLYEYVSEEKKAEAAAAAAARQRAGSFTASLDKYKQASQLHGMEFLQPDTRIRYKTFNYRDQVAVFVGGFRTEDDAVKAAAKVKAWPAPRENRLMDGGAIAKPGADGKQVIEKTYMNPFPQAMVVQNPTVAKAAAPAATGLDPFVVRLNDGRPYNLLKATKPWTLGVKSFGTSVQIQSKDEDTSLMRKIGLGKGADVLNAGAGQAESFAEALRKMKDRNGQQLEAFVLHHRTGSIVTVGQFDGPNDPALHEARRMLSNLSFNESKDAQGANMIGMGQKLFGDTIIPMPVPKVR